MPDPPSYDQHLLDRLNALKKSSIQLDSSKPRPSSSTLTKPSTPESDLSVRLRGLRNGSSPSPISKATVSEPSPFPAIPADDPDPLRHPIDPDNKTLDELLADLGPEDQWTLDPDDPSDIKKLLDEARNALPRDVSSSAPPANESRKESKLEGKRPDKEFLTKDLDMSVFALEDEDSMENGGESRLEYDSGEAQDIVARLLDEVNLDRSNEPQDQETLHDEQEKGDDEEPAFSLPSAPSKLPDPPTELGAETSKKSLDFESDIAARMAALKGLGSTNELGLPSAPTFKPLDKPVKGVMKKYTDEEVESWCIICQDDATVKCLGCDGDLYCASCWKEGHMGPDVGWEERKHKWTKYRKPK